MCTGFEIAALALGTIGAVSSISQGMAMQNQAKYNAAVAENSRRYALDQARIKEQAQRRNALRVMSRQQAQVGVSGGTPSGSALLIFDETAVNAEYEARLTEWEGKIGSDRFSAQGDLDRMRGDAAMSAGIFGAGSSLLTGVARYSRGAAPASGVGSDSYTSFGGGYGGDNVDGLGWE